MNNDVVIGGRPRPLSAGLWTLFSWLRRDDRSDSSDSLSSAGSDRTVASFAFLTPAHYQPATSPLVLPPPGPPTDSYKKRVFERNIRCQYDRDLTLHRKYGLFKSGEITCSYDAFSLPPVRRINTESGNRWDRERRATSECYQRRLAHVPGKRRAPLPPVTEAPAALTTSITRRNTRKRRAPQPPVKLIERNKENTQNIKVNTTVIQMNNHLVQDKQQLRNSDVTMGCKYEKYSKKEGPDKDSKVRPEKSFLKQIFDSKKRNSAIDISSVKVLPSISELDKQAAEIIETCKLNASEPNNNVQTDYQGLAYRETWICVSCLRKYNRSVITCIYCLSNQKEKTPGGCLDESSSASKAANSYTQTEKNLTNPKMVDKNTAEEKQKLKEMLKEMKDSLPKPTKHVKTIKSDFNIQAAEASGTSSYSTETPTLRVGCTVQNQIKSLSSNQPSTSSSVIKTELPKELSSTPKHSSAIVQPSLKVQIMPEFKKITNNVVSPAPNNANTRADTKALIDQQNQKKISPIKTTEQYKNERDLHIPLKISSLLNPVYVPKNLDQNKPQITNALQIETKIAKSNISGIEHRSSKLNEVTQTTSDPRKPTFQLSQLPVKINKEELKSIAEIEKSSTGSPESSQNKKGKTVEITQDNTVLSSSSKQEPRLLKDDSTKDQHSRRRDLIHQLEQSIARGDELAAAQAAAKLAQLRLSCSVLSFSSQILSQPSTSTNAHVEKILLNKEVENNEINIDKKVVAPVHSTGAIKENAAQKAPDNNLLPGTNLIRTSLSVTPGTNTELQQPKQVIQKPVLITNKQNLKENDTMITIAVLVEDREATRGPVYLRIKRQAVMKDLRLEAETSLGLATNLQRWIVGRVLCANDNTPIISLAGPDFSAPFYLCVVDAETKIDQQSQTKIINKLITDNSHQTKAGNVYTELVQLELQALVPNAENFECGVCMEEYTPGRGVVLRECVHIFCKDCLSDVVRHCEEPDIACPAMGCKGMLQEREIRALVTPQDYERWLARGLAAAESGTRNAFHCRTRDCKGWALCEPGVQRFPCPVCKQINCVPCQAIHDGESCEQHRAKLKQADVNKSNSETDEGTRTLLNSLIAKGEALECPECSAIITKKWGCDWVKCSACKTEICWVTRGRRWGPNGKGDTSAGCRCGVDGKRCHPSCGYCH